MKALSVEEFSELWTGLEAENPDEAKIALRLRCAMDLELFALTFFPHYCKHPFNAFHLELFETTQWMERAVRRVRAVSRGYAKSTLTALIKPIHDICYGLEDYIVIISNNQTQANGKLKDIRSEILTNDSLIDCYGIRFPRKNVGETAYEVLCGDHACKLEAYGANTEVRGLRYKQSRPSKIIADDSEHSEEVNNEDIRSKYEDWYFQVISNIGDENTNIEFIGTVLHKESLLMKLLKNPAYDGKLYKAVISWADNESLWNDWRKIYTDLENPDRLLDSQKFYQQHEPEMLKGVKVLWPEKEPYVWLMKEMIEKGKRNFLKEKQNEPLNIKDALFEQMHWYREVPEGIQIESSGKIIKWEHLKHTSMSAMDPATGQTKARLGRSGDYTVILSGYQDPTGRLLVHHDYTKRAGPSKYISELFELHARFNYHKCAIETNLYRNLLLPNIMTEKKHREEKRKASGLANYLIPLPFYDVIQTDNKEKRIFTLEPKVQHGYILFNRALSQDFIGMMEAYPTPGHHDDGPDCLEILWSLMNNRYKLSTVDMNPISGR